LKSEELAEFRGEVPHLRLPHLRPGTSGTRLHLAGGAADNCYAPHEVAVTGCEQLEAIGHPLLRMIETTFGTALADLWRQ
jgi:hypothetical protein